MRVGFPLPLTILIFVICWAAVYIGMRHVLPSLTQNQIKHLMVSAVIGFIALILVGILFAFLAG